MNKKLIYIAAGLLIAVLATAVAVRATTNQGSIEKVLPNTPIPKVTEQVVTPYDYAPESVERVTPDEDPGFEDPEQNAQIGSLTLLEEEEIPNVAENVNPDPEYTADSPIFEKEEDRYVYIFGSPIKFYKISNPPAAYKNYKTAATHMVTIEVPVWRSSGERKVAGAAKLTVNIKLAANVEAIFKEIFELPEQFPIAMVVGFSYRKMVIPWVANNPYLSHHSFGVAIDINKAHNLFYKYADHRPNSKFKITPEVIEVFKKYGWSWGGEFKEGLDTMHFAYLGLSLTEM